MRVALAVVAVLSVGCPASHRRGVDGDADSDSDSDTDSDVDSDVDGGPDGGPKDAGYEEDVYIDPGCADAGPPPTDYQCDLYDEGSCGYGMACYPYVFYPDDPCQEEGYGSICDSPGAGTEDDPCDGAQDCAAGLACFQSGEGRRCLLLCPLDGPTSCPKGQICSPTDIPDMGACS